jgi:predicted nucleic acid-binding protein
MPKTIISDTSCLIILDKINELEILQKVYGEIMTTPEIVEEFGEILPLWIKIKSVKNKSSQKILELQIDKGEASAIALAIETTNSLLILDDFKARKIANSLGIFVTGTLGVIIKAKLNGVIPSIKPLLAKIKNTNFRISEELEKQALIEANENI